MSDFSKRIEGLSDDKRELLEMFLKEKRIDRKWLSQEFVAPETAAEKALAKIWEEVLGVEKVGIHDNFFELGGDSIVSIQIVAKSLQAGLKMDSNQDLFEKPTIAELAPLVEMESTAEGAAEAGSLPTVPAQRYLLEAWREGRRGPCHLVSRKVPAGRPEEGVKQILHLILARHDGLRLRLEEESGDWSQRVVSAEEACTWRAEDLSGQTEAERAAARERLRAETAAAPEAVTGPLLRAVYAHGGGEEGGAAGQGTLFLAVHPLAGDLTTLAVLEEELTAALAPEEGSKARLPAVPPSFRRWLQLWREKSAASQLAEEAAAWKEALQPLPEAPAGLAPSTGDGAAPGFTAEAQLSLEETAALLEEVPKSHRLEADAVLATALARALGSRFGFRRVHLDVDLTGRHLDDGEDFSRTAGPLTLRRALVFELSESGDGLDDLAAVKEAWYGAPGGGLAAVDLPPAPVLLSAEKPLGAEEAGLGGEAAPPLHSLRLERRRVDGALQLSLQSRSELDNGSALVGEVLAATMAELRGLLDLCRESGKAVVTPAEFPHSGLSQEELDGIFS